MQSLAGMLRFARTWSPALVLGALYLHLVLPHGHDLHEPAPVPAPATQHAHHVHGPADHAHDTDAGQHHHELSAHTGSHHLHRSAREADLAPPCPLELVPLVQAPAVGTLALLLAPGLEPPPPRTSAPALPGRGPPAAA